MPSGVFLMALPMVVILTTPFALHAQGRALAIEDYYAIRSVGQPTISPSAEWVAYTVSTALEDYNGNAVSTWVVRTDGSGDPAAVVLDGQDVALDGWEEDGRLRVTREPDAWLVDPSRPTSGVVAPERAEPVGLLSPDGAWRVQTVATPRPAEPEPQMTEFERRHEDRFEGEAFDWYPFRRDGEAFPLPDPDERASTELVLTPADGSSQGVRLTALGLRPGGLAWRPGGSEILFTADESFLDPMKYSRADLFVVTTSGELTRLTDDGYQYSGASWSPDGRWISRVRSLGSDMIIEQDLRHGGARDLYVRPADGGEPVNLTADFDLDAETPMWSPDGAYLYFETGIGGARHLFRVSPDGGGVQQVTEGFRRIGGLDVDPSFRRMTYLVGEFERPSEVWVADIDGANERRLTDVHAEFLGNVEVASRPHARILYESYDGTPVEGFLLFPHDYDPDGSYPLIVMNHGGPHAASGYGFDFKNALFAAHGYFVFLPNFRSSTGYGDDFKWGTWGGWGTNDGEDVMAGIDHLIETYPIDRDRVGSTGHSYGGILTNWLITRYPDRFRAAVSGAGASNWTSNYALSDVARSKELEFLGPPWDPEAREIMIRQSPYLKSGGVQAATLFVHGEEDYRVPLEGAIQLYTSLKKQGVPTKLIIYEGMAHGIRGHWNNVHRMLNELRWWDAWLKPPTASP
jgi:dipeptidyl aminopeptidase/acylaminoacyl peptidase